MTKKDLLKKYSNYYRNRLTSGSAGSYRSYLNVLPFWEIDAILTDWRVVKVGSSKYYETFDPSNKGVDYSKWTKNHTECSEWNYQLFSYYIKYIQGKNIVINPSKKKTQKNLNLQYDYLRYITSFLDENDLVYALTVLDIVESINQKAIDQCVAPYNTKNLDNSRAALALLREWIEFGKTSSGTFYFVQNVKKSSVPATASLLSKLRKKINKSVIHKIDGAIALVREIGINNFIQYAIDQCYFFEPELVGKRMNEIITDYNHGYNLYARKSENTIIQVPDGDTNSNTARTNILNGERASKGLSPIRIGLKKPLKFALFNDVAPYAATNYPIVIDADGNRELRNNVIGKYTGYTVSDGKDSVFQNYRISHIWGRAYDPRFFTNLWNVVLVPAWANDLLDKPNPVKGSLESKLKSTIMRICVVLYFKKIAITNWPSLNMNKPKIINEGIDVIKPSSRIKKDTEESITQEPKNISRDDASTTNNPPYLINIIEEKGGKTLGDIVKYAVYL